MPGPDPRLFEACRRFADALRKSVDVVDDSDGVRRSAYSYSPSISPAASHSLIELTGETGAMIRAAGDEAAGLNAAFETIVRRLKFTGYRMPRIEKHLLDVFVYEISKIGSEESIVVRYGRHDSGASPGTPAGRGGGRDDPERRLAESLRREGKGTRAALVKYMIGRESAEDSDILKHVHDDPAAQPKAIGRNCNRVNEEAEAFGVDLHYEHRSGKVWKTTGSSVSPS